MVYFAAAAIALTTPSVRRAVNRDDITNNAPVAVRRPVSASPASDGAIPSIGLTDPAAVYSGAEPLRPPYPEDFCDLLVAS